MDILAIIPARGGSKGVPGKNRKLLNGKPLLQYSIDAALESVRVSQIVVSTDDEKIAGIAAEAGVEVIQRPKELAGDESLVMDTVRHTIQTKKEAGIEYDLFVLLEPTAPFRTGTDIDETVDIMLRNHADSAATFSETETPPTRIWKIEQNEPKPFIEGSDPFQPRQKQTKGYALNGLVYVLKTETLNKYPKSTSFLMGKSFAHITPKERSLDIDTEFDFMLAEILMQTNKWS